MTAGAGSRGVGVGGGVQHSACVPRIGLVPALPSFCCPCACSYFLDFDLDIVSAGYRDMAR
jgi:hypothetical protein